MVGGTAVKLLLRRLLKELLQSQKLDALTMLTYLAAEGGEAEPEQEAEAEEEADEEEAAEDECELDAAEGDV